MSVKDQERTGPHRIHRDYPTVAVIRTKMHFGLFLAAAFVVAGAITLLQSALSNQGYIAGVVCLLAAVVCAAVAAILDGLITVVAILARLVGDLDARFRHAEINMSDQIAAISRKENRVIREMNGIAGALGEVVDDELDDRRRRN